MSTTIYYDSSTPLSTEAVAVILNKYKDSTLVDLNGLDATQVSAVVAAQPAQTNIFSTVRSDYVAETLPTATVTITAIGSVGAILEVWLENGGTDICLGSIRQYGSAGVNSTDECASALADAITGNGTRFTATSNASVVTITAPVDSGDTYNSRVVSLVNSDTAAITATVVNFIGGVAETQNTWSIEITNSVAGDLMAVTVNLGATTKTLGYVLMTGDATADATTLSAMIQGWVNQGWSSTNPSAGVVKIFPPVGLGLTANGYEVIVHFQTGATSTATVNGAGFGALTGVDETRATGTVTLTSAGRVGDTISLVVNNTVFDSILGEYTVVTGDTVTEIAAGLAASATANYTDHGYTVTSALGVITLRPPVGYGNVTWTPRIEVDLRTLLSATKTNFSAAGVDAVGDQDDGEMSAANATALALLATNYFDVYTDPDYNPVHVAWTTVYPNITVPRAVALLGGYGLSASDQLYAYNLRMLLYSFTYTNIVNYLDIYKRIFDNLDTANTSTTLTTDQDLQCLQLADGELWRQKYITGNKQIGLI